LLVVAHFREFTLGVGEAKRNETLDRGIHASTLRFPQRALEAPAAEKFVSNFFG
jgi:hypothetical protein